MQEKTQNTKNWFSRPQKQRNYIAAHAFEIDASFSCLLTVFLSQAVKEPGNNSLLFPQVKKHVKSAFEPAGPSSRSLSRFLLSTDRQEITSISKTKSTEL